MSAKRCTTSASRSAASPSGSGHCEKALAVKETPAFSMNAWRGSVEIVTGMPCGVCSASAWRALCHRAAMRGSSRAWTLKWVRCLSRTTTEVGRLADRARVLEHRAVRAGLDDGLEHQPDLLRQREPHQQVVDPLVDGQPRVLERVHPPVPVEVAELHALGAGQLHPVSIEATPAAELLHPDDRAQRALDLRGGERPAKDVVGHDVAERSHDHGLVQGQVAPRDLPESTATAS